MRFLALLLAAVAVTLSAAVPASATFPGRNGPIAHGWVHGKDYWSQTGISLIDPRSRKTREGPRSCSTMSGEGGCMLSGASFSPHGRLTFTVDDYSEDLGAVTGSTLQTLSPDGATTRSVAISERAIDPAWSPSGSMLLVTRFVGQHADLYEFRDLFLLGADGRELGRVTTGGGEQADWSVDGTIAYVDDGEIWLTRLGAPARRLTFYGGRSPSWSPDGRRLAFVRGGDVWTVRPDGRARRHLTRQGTDEEPTWSPDGRRIAFLRRPSADSYTGEASLLTMRSDGGAPREVSRDIGFGTLAWKPLAPPRRR